ncbi:hypothetical protein AT5G44585 [Arabidopsis thaliana]|jgi:hypothetical protein|uniref:Serine rich endogenous peptide 12 n=1 Tax=Arabidopsis thaliana TaxID=3702 RepID=SOP12_ARATH|nr:uncharacterized protein AT5G44585 [Arabidopsis thaliana]B3H7I1.1 RecName: Full=Serine rich endogenous peptide 12; Short=AtSCOOP12; AltName: Full=Phytocytokine SCOOP12; AltName: Full=Precursor of serine rich endogenous peptide phytocytokine 12; Flags: Precursor [Arabidopsis thaliana]AED95135.1 hypothetical protein AT5G44585 [Arabidopsis thaliana]|eukprot:NP_001119372.1 hypothetical protein AT5G44585 [Arabidopsis thaliana]
MRNTISSKMGQVLIVLLLLCTVLCRTESALPSGQHSVLLTGRRLMGSGASGPVRSSQSSQAGGRFNDADPIAIDYGKY